MKDVRKIRIFVDAHVFDDSLQGSRTYIKGLYYELIRMNPDVIFYFGAYDIENLKKEIEINENVRFIKYISRNKILRLALLIPFIILKHKIDLSHFQYISPLFKFSKEIVTIHDILFLDFPEFFPPGYRFRNRLLFRLSARRADYLLTVSSFSREGISSHFKINPDLISIIPNGVADEFFEDQEDLPDVKKIYCLEKYLLFVSRIEPRKNHYLLLKAFVELGLWKDGYKLVLIGSRSLKVSLFDDYLLNLDDKIKNSVILVGSAHGRLLKSFYINCTLFIYPSFAEGFGIPPLEAAAAGAHVLCSGLTAMSDYKFFGEQLFDASSLKIIKEKILQGLEKNKSDIKFIKNHIKENYTWGKSASIFKTVVLDSFIS